MRPPICIIPATELSGTNADGCGLNAEAIAREPLGIPPRIRTFLSSPASWLHDGGGIALVAALVGENRARIQRMRV